MLRTIAECFGQPLIVGSCDIALYPSASIIFRNPGSPEPAYPSLYLTAQGSVVSPRPTGISWSENAATVIRAIQQIAPSWKTMTDITNDIHAAGTSQKKATVRDDFCIEGSEQELKALVEECLTKFGVSLDRNFAAVFSDCIRHRRRLDGRIVARLGSKILEVGGHATTQFVLPADKQLALNAIGRFFGS